MLTTSRSKRVQWALAAVPQGRKQALLVVIEAIIDLLHRRLCMFIIQRAARSWQVHILFHWESLGDDKLYPLNVEQKSSLSVKMRRALVLCCGLVVQRALSITAPKQQRCVTVFACVKHIFQASTSRGDESGCDCWTCQCAQPAACSTFPQSRGCTTVPDSREQPKCSQSRGNSSPHEGVKQPLLEAPVGMLWGDAALAGSIWQSQSAAIAVKTPCHSLLRLGNSETGIASSRNQQIFLLLCLHTGEEVNKSPLWLMFHFVGH